MSKKIKAEGILAENTSENSDVTTKTEINRTKFASELSPQEASLASAPSADGDEKAPESISDSADTDGIEPSPDAREGAGEGSESAPTATDREAADTEADAADTEADEASTPENDAENGENTSTEPQNSSSELQNTSADPEKEALRAELARYKARADELVDGFTELCSLWPDADLAAMPDSFRESVLRGVPPAAAYALELRRREVAEKRAREAHARAKSLASGGAGASSERLLSPEEVRAMTPVEVRARYKLIEESMKHWK